MDTPFRRNLLGLKRVGLGIAVAGLVTSGWALFYGWRTASVILPVPSVTALITACIVIAWMLGVRPDAVRITADRYARYLLEAALDLQPS